MQSADGVNDREARIRALLPLVKKIARRVHRLVPGVDVGDLVGDGSIGLIRAVDQFDSQRGPSIEQYARGLIVGSMLNGIRRMDPVSERVRRCVRDGETERYRIAVERGSLPDLQEMERRRPGFTRATAAAHARTPLSLDAPLPEGESLAGDWSGDPATIVAERDNRCSLGALIATLPPRQAYLMREHYYRERSLRDVCRTMNVSPQRASQLHLAAMTSLRKRIDASTR